MSEPTGNPPNPPTSQEDGQNSGAGDQGPDTTEHPPKPEAKPEEKNPPKAEEKKFTQDQVNEIVQRRLREESERREREAQEREREAQEQADKQKGEFEKLYTEKKASAEAEKGRADAAEARIAELNAALDTFLDTELTALPESVSKLAPARSDLAQFLAWIPNAKTLAAQLAQEPARPIPPSPKPAGTDRREVKEATKQSLKRSGRYGS